MLEPLQPEGDLAGEIQASKELFQAWLRFGPRHGECPCAEAILFYARSLQGDDMRGAVGPDSAWELCCRELTLPDNQASIGTRLLANFVIYLLEGGPVRETEGETLTAQLPVQMRDVIYAGMEDDLIARGKDIRTGSEECAMKTRWARQWLQSVVGEVSRV